MGTSNLKSIQIAILAGIGTYSALGCLLIHKGMGFSGFIATGPQAKTTLSVPDFDRIQAGESFEVDVKFGSVPSVIFEAPRDLLPHLIASFNHGTLDLHSNVSYSTTGASRVKAHVVARRLTGASVSGAGRMVINGKVNSDTFDASASGASTLNMSAAVNSFKLESSGSSKATINGLTTRKLNIEASGAATCTINGTSDASIIEASGSSNLKGRLTTGSAEVEASGASHATLHVINSFNGEATGASVITYSGRPPKVKTDISGAGRISSEG